MGSMLIHGRSLLETAAFQIARRDGGKIRLPEGRELWLPSAPSSGKPRASISNEDAGRVVDSKLGGGWDGKPIEFKHGDRTVRFTPLGNAIRVEDIGPGQKFVDERTLFTLKGATEFPGLDVRVMHMEPSRDAPQGMVVIRSGDMRLIFKPDGRPLHAGNLEIRNIPRPDDKDFKAASWNPDKKNDQRRSAGGATRTQDLFGIGKEKNQHGGLQADFPGVVSRQGFYVHEDKSPIMERGVWPRHRAASEHGRDLYVSVYGNDSDRAMQALADIGGPAAMPLGQMLGTADSWWQKLTADQYKQRIQEYVDRGYPIDAMALDMEALDGSKAYIDWARLSWNRNLIPDPRGMHEFLRSQMVMTFLNLHPHGGVGPREDGYDAFMRDLDQSGYNQGRWRHGDRVPPDFADRRYVEAWIKNVLEPLRNDGVRIWWLDYQPTQGKEWWRGQDLETSIKGLTTGGWLTHVLFHQSRGVNVGDPNYVETRAPDQIPRGTVLARYEGIDLGMWRYPIEFSGDAYVQFKVLAAQIKSTVASGTAGAFFWSHDIGGHLHMKEPELLARWTWFGALSSCNRVHACDNPNADPRPWLYGEQCADATKRAYRLRSELFPLIYTQAWRVHDEMRPMILPMSFEKDTTQSRQNPQQYMLGDLLVAPIADEGRGPGKLATQKVWFPKGTWYNLLTNERFKGDDRLLVAGSLEEVPIYAKGGVPITMQPVSMHMGSEQIKTLVVRAYPGPDNKEGFSELHEDDRTTEAYTASAYATTGLKYARSGSRLVMEVGEAKGSFNGQPGERGYRFEFAATERADASSISINGKSLWDVPGSWFEYDEARKTNVVTVPTTSIRERVTVALDAREVDPRIAADSAHERRMHARFENARTEDRLENMIAARAYELGPNANAQDDEGMRGLLELAGVGFDTPQDGPYGWSPYANMLLQPFYGSQIQDLGKRKVDVRDVSVTVEDRCDGQSRVVFSQKLSEHRSGRYNLPLPALETNGGRVERFVTMRFTVHGHPITIHRKVDEREQRRAFAPTNVPYDTNGADITPDVTVNGYKVYEMDRVGLVAANDGRTWVNQQIRDAVGRHGGPTGLGFPKPYVENDDPKMRLAHRWWESGRDWGVTLQNFDWGEDRAYRGACAVVHQDNAPAAFMMRGDVWAAWSARPNGPCVGLETVGFPISDEVIVDGKRTQYFERGAMVEESGRWTFSKDKPLGLRADEKASKIDWAIRQAALQVGASPADNGSSALVHRWGKGWVQDLVGGKYDKSIAMHRFGLEAFVVGGPIWAKYTASDGMSRLGYPVSRELEVGGRRIQYFERCAIKEVAPNQFEIVEEKLPARERR
jgi:alpha-glucosidase (family GH31 glycosyl hydrolase)